MRMTARMSDVGKVLAEVQKRYDRAKAAAIKETADSLKQELRAQVRAAGLGERLANTWRSKYYEDSGEALVWSRAPQIIRSYTNGATIRPLGGKRFLWVPTDNVPRERGGRRGSRKKASPLEVELQFNQDLIIRRGKGRNFLAFVKAVRGKRAGTVRRATQRRLAQGRKEDLILMFVLVPTVHKPKLLDVAGAAKQADQTLARSFAEHFNRPA